MLTDKADGMDMPMSIFDVKMRKLRKQAPGTSMCNYGDQLNFFPKPSPKYQDDDTNKPDRPSSSGPQFMNNSKLSGFDNSMIS